MYYEEQWTEGALCWRTSPDGAWTRYTANELAHRYESAEKRAADAQATVEALQRERDGAYKQGFADALEKVASDWASKEFRGHDEIQGVEVQAFLDSRHVHYEECRGVKPLQAALDAERERSKRQAEEAIVVFAQLAQLQALVRAFVDHFDGDFENPGLELYGQVNGQEIANGGKALNDLLDKARATLGATTPARWTAEEIEQAKRKAKELGEAIGWPKGGDDE